MLALTLLWALSTADPSIKDVPYDFDRTWNSTERYLRVDLRWKIKESDKDIGYLIFEFVDEKRKIEASLELVRAGEERGNAVRLRLRADQVSIYRREKFLDQIALKLRDDYGRPPPKKKPVEETPKNRPDAGIREPVLISPTP